MRKRISLSTVVAALVIPVAAVVVSISTAGAAGPAATCARVPSDFNGDGHADLAVGEPHRKVGTVQGAGDVRVIYGGSSGLTTTNNQYFDESSFGSLTSVAEFDSFGAITVAGYFNSDCYADLAVSAPTGQTDSVTVLYGSSTGLKASTANRFVGTQLGDAAARDDFGWSMASGDFNGDGLADLAIGTPGGFETSAGPESGGVGVLYGSATGLRVTGTSWITQASSGVPGTGAFLDNFGWSVAAGDFTGDGKTDLAVGEPNKPVGSVTDTGAVVVLHGSATGLTGTGSQMWSQDSTGVPDTSQVNDEFGQALAAGDVTGDGKADLLIGTPGKSLGAAQFAGVAFLLPGATAGLTATGSQEWSQNSTGVPGTSETDDSFGASLVMGDFNGDGHADAAVGVPGESVGTLAAAGTVDVLYGRTAGLTATGSQAWTQNSKGVAGASETGDDFGGSLQALRIVSTGHADLVVGVPGESSAGSTNNGAVAVLRGGSSGITATGNQFMDASHLVNGVQFGAELSLTAL